MLGIFVVGMSGGPGSVSVLECVSVTVSVSLSKRQRPLSLDSAFESNDLYLMFSLSSLSYKAGFGYLSQ